MAEPLEQRVSIKNFQTPAERVTGSYINAIGIYFLAKESLGPVYYPGKSLFLGNPRIEISGDMSLDFHLRRYCPNGPEIRKPCGKIELEELSTTFMRIFWSIGTCDYVTFAEESASREFDDQSGENVTHSFLLENNIPVLMSAQYLAYEVDRSGDDYPTSVIRRTELLTDSGGIAKYIFQQVKDNKINYDALMRILA